MNHSQWARVKDVFHAALDVAAKERDAFVDAACDGDAVLKSEVERLLAAATAAGDFLEQSPGAAVVRPSMTGQMFGRYTIGRLIGMGGMGQVYAAHDHELKREVAIKIGLDLNAGPRLRREAQHASALNHPHICTIHEIGSSNGQAYIVMEYVAGQCLRDVIPAHGLPLPDVARYGAQIADALAYAHDHGVTHRDLKTANIVLTEDDRAKVLDFGLSRAATPHQVIGPAEPTASVTAPGVLVGTLAYMAPELLRGEPASASTDIWALGVMLYEMVSGTRPFAGATGFGLTGSILHEPPAPLSPNVPPALRQVISSCLAKTPGERYVSAHEVRAALEQAIPDSDGSRSRHVSAAPEAGREPTLRRRPVLILGAALVVTAVALSVWAIRVNGPVGLGASGRPAIAVMSFENFATEPETAWLARGIPSMLLTGLAQTRGLDIVSGQRLNEVVRQLGGAELETAPRGQFAEIAERAGAGAMVVGAVSRAGAEIRIDAQLQDLATGRILAAQSVRGTDLFLLVDQLTARIRDDIGLRNAGDIRALAEISTKSLEAFQIYTQGVDAFVEYRWEEARSLLERAVAIDPRFADAYLHLAHTNFFLGNPALQLEYLHKAADNADRLGARQRLVLDLELARASGDGTAAARTLDQLIRTFPDDEDAYNIAFQLYQPLLGLIHDPQKLLIVAAQGAAAMPKSSLTLNLYAYALLALGRHEEAVSEFQQNVRMADRQPNPHDSLGEAYLVTGNPARALESYKQALTLDPTFSFAHGGLAWGFGMLGRFDEALAEQPPFGVRAFLLSRVGRYREAAQLVANGKREAEISGNIAEHGQLFLLSAQLAIEQRDYLRAVQECDEAERLFLRLPKTSQRVRLGLFHVMKGLALARAANLAEARTHVEAASRLFNSAVEPEMWWYQALQTEVALAGGDLSGAAARFSSGLPARKMWFETLRSTLAILANNFPTRDALGRVARAEGESAKALQTYRQLLSSGPEQKFVAVFEPRYVLEIARLLDRTGDGGGAVREYQRFLEFWSRADADAPEAGEARRAMARLATAR